LFVKYYRGEPKYNEKLGVVVTGFLNLLMRLQNGNVSPYSIKKALDMKVDSYYKN